MSSHGRRTRAMQGSYRHDAHPHPLHDSSRLRCCIDRRRHSGAVQGSERYMTAASRDSGASRIGCHDLRGGGRLTHSAGVYPSLNLGGATRPLSHSHRARPLGRDRLADAPPSRRRRATPIRAAVQVFSHSERLPRLRVHTTSGATPIRDGAPPKGRRDRLRDSTAPRHGAALHETTE